MSCYKNRIRQFTRAIVARVTQEDNFYISKYLNCSAQKLFYTMNVIDQVHSLRTAYSIEKLLDKKYYKCDREFLIRCALLHDIGKIFGNIKITGKILSVIVTTLAPGLAQFLMEKGNKTIYIYHHHAELGAKILRQIDLLREAEIISKHHAQSNLNDPLELKLLRIADDNN